MMNGRAMRIRITRYDPDVDANPVVRSYKVPVREGLTVLEALYHIWENEDPTVAFRYACKAQRCGVCRVLVDGRVCLACAEPATDGMWIGAVRDGELIRDLVIDVFPNVVSPQGNDSRF